MARPSDTRAKHTPELPYSKQLQARLITDQFFHAHNGNPASRIRGIAYLVEALGWQVPNSQVMDLDAALELCVEAAEKCRCHCEPSAGLELKCLRCTVLTAAKEARGQ